MADKHIIHGYQSNRFVLDQRPLNLFYAKDE